MQNVDTEPFGSDDPGSVNQNTFLSAGEKNKLVVPMKPHENVVSSQRITKTESPDQLDNYVDDVDFLVG